MANDMYCDDSYLQAQQEQEMQEYLIMIYDEEHKLEMANQQLSNFNKTFGEYDGSNL